MDLEPSRVVTEDHFDWKYRGCDPIDYPGVLSVAEMKLRETTIITKLTSRLTNAQLRERARDAYFNLMEEVSEAIEVHSVEVKHEPTRQE